MKLHRTSKAFAILLTVLGLVGLVGQASAHRLWILPSYTVLSGEDQWVSFEAAVSNNLFYPNHVALRLDGVHAISPSGQELELQSPAQGKIRSSFELQLKEQGTYRIYSGGGMMFASWTEDGEKKRKRGTDKEFAAMDLASMEDLQLRKNINRVETYVSAGEPTDITPSGKGLELEFISHPNDLYTGETAQFRVLLDGKPSSGQKITVVKGNDRYRDTEGSLELESDSEGLIEVSWDQAGRYWINGSTQIAGGEFHGYEVKRGASYTLVVEVLPE
ncbi:DUF4198 domain-containing protein [Pelagicoccus albus]|uniref:DUF4198 domain-containing protein n=1 Tax=Pelagicoccus albus TaxID=415222 RepID=A0A7X1B599_9BACT|nr:DUF4198 domain-containing protein [Pelagicoccus albus]MBC2605909.1 DUF4198 domain-containing protein [Pelagicoccus albus]